MNGRAEAVPSLRLLLAAFLVFILLSGYGTQNPGPSPIMLVTAAGLPAEAGKDGEASGDRRLDSDADPEARHRFRHDMQLFWNELSRTARQARAELERWAAAIDRRMSGFWSETQGKFASAMTEARRRAERAADILSQWLKPQERPERRTPPAPPHDDPGEPIAI